MTARAVYGAGRSTLRALERAVRDGGAGEAELAAVQRLRDGRAELVDLERLAPLAARACLPWAELYPELANAEPGAGRPPCELCAAAPATCRIHHADGSVSYLCRDCVDESTMVPLAPVPINIDGGNTPEERRQLDAFFGRLVAHLEAAR